MTTNLPDRNLLAGHAATMRGEAEAQRKLLEQKLLEHRSTVEAQESRANALVAAKKAEITSIDESRSNAASESKSFREMAAEEDMKATAAEKAGNAPQAEEAREQATRFRSVATVADQNLANADRDLANLRVELAERERDSRQIIDRLSQGNKEIHLADRALDQMEDQARLLDEASRKLALAAATDNPVEIADAELAAERLYGQARAIDVDEAIISGATGRSLTEIELPAPGTTVATTDDALGTDAFAAQSASTPSAVAPSLADATASTDGDGDASAEPADDTFVAAAPESETIAMADATALASDAGMGNAFGEAATESGLDLDAATDGDAAAEPVIDDGADLGSF